MPMFNLILGLGLFFLLLSILAIVIGLLGLIRAPKRGSKQRFNQPTGQAVMRRGAPGPLVDSHLRRDLLALLGGNQDTANRLLSQVESSNPGRPVSWYFEKVIKDLERDRR